MCLTGSFALLLMAEDAVVGGVASQPALPAFGANALHMSRDDVDRACTAMAQKGPGLAMRFRGDKLVPDGLFEALETAFGDDLETLEFDGARHSLLTLHFHQPAYDKVEAYFHARFAR